MAYLSATSYNGERFAEFHCLVSILHMLSNKQHIEPAMDLLSTSHGEQILAVTSNTGQI